MRLIVAPGFNNDRFVALIKKQAIADGASEVLVLDNGLAIAAIKTIKKIYGCPTCYPEKLSQDEHGTPTCNGECLLDYETVHGRTERPEVDSNMWFCPNCSRPVESLMPFAGRAGIR